MKSDIFVATVRAPLTSAQMADTLLSVMTPQMCQRYAFITFNNPPPVSSMADLALMAALVMQAAPDMAAVTEAPTVARITASRSIPRPQTAHPVPPLSLGTGQFFPSPPPPGPPPPPPLPPLPPPFPPHSLVPAVGGFLSGGVFALFVTSSSCPSDASSESYSTVAVVVEKRPPGRLGVPGCRGTISGNGGWRAKVGPTCLRGRCIVNGCGNCRSVFLSKALSCGGGGCSGGGRGGGGAGGVDPGEPRL